MACNYSASEACGTRLLRPPVPAHVVADIGSAPSTAAARSCTIHLASKITANTTGSHVQNS